MRVVITGFGPFPGMPENPTATLAKALARSRRPALARLIRVSHVFATTYAAVDRDLATLFADKPDIVLMFGVAGRRRALCIEARARNARSLLDPDASGRRPDRMILTPGGPTQRSGNRFAPALVAAARRCGVSARLSQDAGRYVCNYAYWRALERADRSRPLVQFVHVPPLRLRPRRRSAGGRRPPLGAVITAGEAMLIGLLIASRR